MARTPTKKPTAKDTKKAEEKKPAAKAAPEKTAKAADKADKATEGKAKKPTVDAANASKVLKALGGGGGAKPAKAAGKAKPGRDEDDGDGDGDADEDDDFPAPKAKAGKAGPGKTKAAPIDLVDDDDAVPATFDDDADDEFGGAAAKRPSGREEADAAAMEAETRPKKGRGGNGKAPDGPTSMRDKLIELGKQKGFVTYDEVNDHMPDDVVSTDQIDSWLSALGEQGTVGKGPPNFYGVYDLHGLVWEWVLDFNTALLTGDSRTDASGLERGLFCGAGSQSARDSLDYPAFMRTGFRSSLQASYCVHNLGFRCAKDL